MVRLLCPGSLRSARGSAFALLCLSACTASVGSDPAPAGDVAMAPVEQLIGTAACSTDADDELTQLASLLEWLKKRGVAVSRYNLGHEPGAFVTNAMVKGTLAKDGMACLPLVIADGRIISKGRYPSRDELGAEIEQAVAAGYAPVGTTQ